MLKYTAFCTGVWVAFLGLAALPATSTSAQAATSTITVDVAHPSHAISPMLYGMMTEEINHSYDGGLYAELIQNRAFKDNKTDPVKWTLVQDGGAAGSWALDTDTPLNAANPVSLKLTAATTVAPGERVGAANEGYWGIPVRPSTTYNASFYAKGSNGFAGPVDVDIESSDGATVFAKASIARITDKWAKYTTTLTTSPDAKPSASNRFVLSVASPGTVHVTLVSLFPPTFDNQANGFRSDLMEIMGDMNPAFLRLPGGNYLEGNSIPEHFEWKNTIHDISLRPGHQCCWGYPSSDGLGLLEYLEWCEDLHMQPVLALYAGYSLNRDYIKPGADLAPYVQDGMDEIEYVTGGTKTRWGRQRASDGHPKAFPLTYVEISNEDGGHQYAERYKQFYDAIKAKYPHLQIIATSWQKSVKEDVVDDHYYRSAAAMEQDAHHYDSFDRKGPKIFVGEWATTEGAPTPIFDAALGDAAWLTGLERNSDLVQISAYAPLLVNVNHGASQWGTNLIGYNALTAYASPSYYVQQMFSKNRGDVVLPVDEDINLPTDSAAPRPHGGIGVGAWSTQAEYRNIKVTQADQVLYQKDFATGTDGWNVESGTWQVDDGAFEQTGAAADCRATTGETTWTDYTLTLQARKISGAEGFLIMFHAQDHDNYTWWNIGGWGNTHTAIEKSVAGTKSSVGPEIPIKVESGRWYDIKITVAGDDIKCYLDGKLAEEVRDSHAAGPIYSEASRDKATGDVILKVVNVTASDLPVTINLNGANSVQRTATGEVLAGDPKDTNTIDDPNHIVPVPITITDASAAFAHTFPAHSISVIRVTTK